VQGSQARASALRSPVNEKTPLVVGFHFRPLGRYIGARTDNLEQANRVLQSGLKVRQVGESGTWFVTWR
jgi:hypothetical protein